MKSFYLSLLIVVLFFSCESKSELKKLSGPIFGTSYNIQYYTNSNQDFSKSIDSLFYVINKSMSNYQTNSIISKINRNEEVGVDSHFKKVFNASKDVYSKTNGFFDPTIGALVNYWSFGAKKNEHALDSLKIDSLMRFVDFSKVDLSKNLISKQKETYIDFNAVAKGYAVDVVSEFLSKKDLENHLVEIGGEIRVKGKNLNKNKLWKVGIQEPNFNGETDYNKALAIQNEAIATSGTYRKFKVDENGNRYAHIINTKTGYPTKTNVLSVSVIAPNCMLADAYATAFQAMGIEKVTSFLKNHPELKVFFIFENTKQELETISLNGFSE
ncbi:FAD:protein FMN transferase [Aurantibacter sp.]|uniref:FAD:protein FMN transferase n=1 Tax=Aurantibacter sp. TaxID=2807103 RepID=UPI0035C8326A